MGLSDRAFWALLGTGAMGLGVSAHKLLFAELPEELSGIRFHVKTKEAVLKSLATRDPRKMVGFVDEALMMAAKRYGEVSEQYTAILAYKAKLLEGRAYSCGEIAGFLLELLKKPHVGEAVAEERRRLACAFRLFHRLKERTECSDDHARLAPVVKRTVDRIPAHLHNQEFDRIITASRANIP